MSHSANIMKNVYQYRGNEGDSWDVIVYYLTMALRTYYFALLYNSVVYVFPKAISYAMAEDIMRLPNESNDRGRYSVFSYHQSNAYNVAYSATGMIPHGPEIEGDVSNGHLWHYHTNGHRTSAHAFYII